MAPIRRGDGTELNPQGFTEVRKGDGTVLWSAIPDSEADDKLIHRWVLDDVNGTVEDSIGDADGTVNGVTSVSGDYAGGSAGDADGTDDYIETTTWGDFGSNMDSDFAITFSIDTPASEDVIMGAINSGGEESQTLTVSLNDEFEGSNGTLTWAIRGEVDDLSDSNSVESSTDLTGGGPYRVALNKTGNSASDMGIWINQLDDNASVNLDDFDETSIVDFDEPVALFAYNARGTIEMFFEGVIDDVCVFNDSLSQSEIESYNNPWG